VYQQAEVLANFVSGFIYSRSYARGSRDFSPSEIQSICMGLVHSTFYGKVTCVQMGKIVQIVRLHGMGEISEIERVLSN